MLDGQEGTAGVCSGGDTFLKGWLLAWFYRVEVGGTRRAWVWGLDAGLVMEGICSWRIGGWGFYVDGGALVSGNADMQCVGWDGGHVTG